jgi:glycosyltransferase involved in cell wall biosynthesis
MKSGKRRVRILVSPVEIAGYYRNLCEGFRKLGVSYDFVTIADHPFGYAGETCNPILLRIVRWLKRFQDNPKYPFAIRAFCALPIEFLRVIWAIGIVWRYDVFIFGFGQTLVLNNLDLPLLKLMGKTVICNLGHGSEARPSYINGAYLGKDGKVEPSLARLSRLAKKQRKRVLRFERHASILVGAPYSTTQFALKRMVNWFALGVPFDGPLDDSPDHEPSQGIKAAIEKSAVKILHAPSRPTLKGTKLIIDAVDELRRKGYEIDLTLLQGRPFSDVILELAKCDFVVDQVYSDTPMATFAAEAAWFGKPAVVGGYGLDRIGMHIPDSMMPISKTCHPDFIQLAIEELIVDRDRRELLGEEARKFVCEKWSTVNVAKRYIRLIEFDIPDHWWLEPSSVVYFEGCGQSEACSKKNIQLLVERYGQKSLQLFNRPALERAFLDFAKISQNS